MYFMIKTFQFLQPKFPVSIISKYPICGMEASQRRNILNAGTTIKSYFLLHSASNIPLGTDVNSTSTPKLV